MSVRLRTGVIGVGRAGSALGAALARAGHPVVAAHAVSESSQERAQTLLPQADLVDVDEVVQRSDLLLLAVPDDALEALVLALDFKPGQFVVHCSGRYGVKVLAPAQAQGALPLALHPAMTLTGTSLDADRLSGAPFAVTSAQPLRMAAEALVVEMGGEPIWIPEEARPVYHAALAHSANHLITLVASGMEMLTEAGVDTPGRLLTPLLQASLDNALRMGYHALTGPVVRGDASTVAAHVAVLADDPQLRAAYIAMARLTADRALADGLLKPVAAEGLLNALGGPS
ncbi:MAG TPA: DUF2520 domain-containing protein [Actinomycetota bacterium]|nr:DUF2520 domain-containing protein [Actinomycetota bacterium]HPJ18560.1 DUF2520 domain-containing protein [Actinomycetota bacterium]HRV66812.1 DUF2520 domain-containing protein [Candidatus Nanopelagicales bacterium]